jgi:hypothetical protein
MSFTLEKSVIGDEPLRWIHNLKDRAEFIYISIGEDVTLETHDDAFLTFAKITLTGIGRGEGRGSVRVEHLATVLRCMWEGRAEFTLGDTCRIDFGGSVFEIPLYDNDSESLELPEIGPDVVFPPKSAKDMASRLSALRPETITLRPEGGRIGCSVAGDVSGTFSLECPGAEGAFNIVLNPTILMWFLKFMGTGTTLYMAEGHPIGLHSVSGGASVDIFLAPRVEDDE